MVGLDATPLSRLSDAVTFIEGDGAPSQAELAAACAAAFVKVDALLSDGPDEHGLSRDEMAAVHVYTQQLMFRPLNRALWSERRDAVKPYWGFIRLLQHALFKLPKCAAGTIYRGGCPATTPWHHTLPPHTGTTSGLSQCAV